MEGFNDAYHIFIDLRLNGPLDETALRRALTGVLARHEALRTTFYTIDGTMYQRIGPQDAGFELTALDLSQAQDHEARLQQLRQDEASAPFDLEKGPLIRGRLIRLEADSHALLITMHHIVSDGWSVRVFMRELGALYQAFHGGGGDGLAPLAIQYADYAAWQRQGMSEDMAAEQGTYWKRALSGAPSLLELPTDRPRPPRQDFHGATIPIEFDPALTAKLNALSQRHGTTLFMTVLAGFALVLSRLANQDDIVIGVPAANRDHLEIEGLIGFFINTLALRIDFSGQPSVEALLERVKTASIEAQAHQALPFEQVIDLVKPARTLAHPPLFQVMFAWQSHESGSFDLPGLEGTRVRNEQEPAKFDLTLELRELHGRISGGLNYATALFDPATAERYAGYLHAALSEMAADESQLAAAVQLLPASEERHKLLVDWNATDVAVPRDACIHQLFEVQVERDGAAIAVAHAGVQLSYGALNAKANQLAHHLRSLGVGPDHPVAICVERSAEMMVGLLAILKTGGAYVPLDPAYPAERLGFMLKDSQPAIVLSDPGARASLDDALASAGLKATILDLKTDTDDWASQPATNPAGALTPSHLAYIIYTSGSTGKPKGVMVSHGNVCNFHLCMAALLGIHADDRLLAVTSLSFDIAGLELFLPLIRGACMFIANRATAMDGMLLGSVLTRNRISVLQGTPSIWRLLKEANWHGGRSPPYAAAKLISRRMSEQYLKSLGPARLSISMAPPKPPSGR